MEYVLIVPQIPSQNLSQNDFCDKLPTSLFIFKMNFKF